MAQPMKRALRRTKRHRVQKSTFDTGTAIGSADERAGGKSAAGPVDLRSSAVSPSKVCGPALRLAAARAHRHSIVW